MITEAKKEKVKVVFVETDGRAPFPNNTMSALEKSITKLAKDLETEWDSATKLVNTAFEESNVPIPGAHLKERWEQYTKLLAHAIRELHDARGFASWSRTV